MTSAGCILSCHIALIAAKNGRSTMIMGGHERSYLRYGSSGSAFSGADGRVHPQSVPNQTAYLVIAPRDIIYDT